MFLFLFVFLSSTHASWGLFCGNSLRPVLIVDLSKENLLSRCFRQPGARSSGRALKADAVRANPSASAYLSFIIVSLFDFDF